METLESILEKNLSKENLAFVNKLLYGPQQIRCLDMTTTPVDLCDLNLEIKGFSFCEDESTCKKVRVGLFQNSIVEKTNSPIAVQRDALLDLGQRVVSLAASIGVNIFCFQEIWNMPVAFCTQKKLPWVEFAENALEGPTTIMLQQLAKKHEMVIISPILERDAVEDCIWNSAVVINKTGEILGVSRKNHLPISGRFSETYYCKIPQLSHPVFQTDFGRVGVSLCYERHHPQCWFSYGLNGAEIMFNPSATVQSFSEYIWPIESRDAAIKNGFYTCAINRVGNEHFQITEGDEIVTGPFFGSSYVTAPDGSRTFGLSINRNGLLVADLDLTKCSTESASSRIANTIIFEQ